jgi:hypothetical protein
MSFKTMTLVFILMAVIILVASWRVGLAEVARARGRGDSEASFVGTSGSRFLFGTVILAPLLISFTLVLAALENISD